MEKYNKKYHTPKEVLEAAKSLDTSAEELDALLEWGFPFVKEAVARNSNSSINTLRKLIPDNLDTWDNASIACALTDNVNSDRELMVKLFEKLPPAIKNGREDHDIFRAGIRLCLNEKSPLNQVKSILTNPDTCAEFRKVFAREAFSKDLLSILLNDKSERVRNKAAARINFLEQEII